MSRGPPSSASHLNVRLLSCPRGGTKFRLATAVNVSSRVEKCSILPGSVCNGKRAKWERTDPFWTELTDALSPLVSIKSVSSSGTERYMWFCAFRSIRRWELMLAPAPVHSVSVEPKPSSVLHVDALMSSLKGSTMAFFFLNAKSLNGARKATS